MNIAGLLKHCLDVELIVYLSELEAKFEKTEKDLELIEAIKKELKERK